MISGCSCRLALVTMREPLFDWGCQDNLDFLIKVSRSQNRNISFDPTRGAEATTLSSLGATLKNRSLIRTSLFLTMISRSGFK